MSAPRLIAVYGRRHEPDWLVEGLIANVSPWVDGIAVVDDRGRDPAEPWGHEGRFRARQRQAAVDAGADWVLVLDPDERLEDRAGEVIRPLVEQNRDELYRLRLCELFTPTAYRVDGRWNVLRRARLYPIRPGQQMSDKPIHAPPIPVRTGYPVVDLDVNLYHLKMIEPANRAARARAYSRAEAQHGVRLRQWGALRTTGGMRLRSIAAGRGFSPGYSRPYRVGGE